MNQIDAEAYERCEEAYDSLSIENNVLRQKLEAIVIVLAQERANHADTLAQLEAAERLLGRCMEYLEGDDELRKSVYAAIAAGEET